MLWRPMSPASGSKGAHADRPGARGAGALLALGLTAGGLAAAAGAPGLELSACELEHPQRLTVVAAECGVLPVAENPQDPAGRPVPLRVEIGRASWRERVVMLVEAGSIKKKKQ